MPGGLNLGGAFFTLYGDNAQLLQTMAQARAATLQATQAMANASTNYARAEQATNATIKAMYTQMAQQWTQTAAVHSAAVKQMTADLEKLGYSMKSTAASSAALAGSLKSVGATLATLTGFGAIASGALLVRESILGVLDASQKLNQEQFRSQALFKDLAPMYQRQAEALGHLAGKPLSDAIAATNQFATVQRQYGITAKQVADLQLTVANAAAVGGVSLEEAAKRVAPALRGEAEAIEYLGFSLQSDYLKALQDVNSEEYKRWQQMGPRAKAQIVLNELQKQSNDITGAAAERANSAAGAFDKMNAAVENLQAKIGQMLNPELVRFAQTISTVAPMIGFVVDKLALMNATAAEFAKQKGLPDWMLAIPGIAPVLAEIDALLGNVAKKAAEAKAQAEIGPTQKEVIAAQREAERQAKLDAIENAKARTKTIADLEKKARDKAVEEENRLYQDRKDALTDDKNARIKAAEDAKAAAIEAIRVEKEAAEELYQTRLAHLQKLKDEELNAAEARHQSAVRALAAEKDAVEHASEAQQRRIKDQEEADTRASQDRLRTIKTQLEAEERERDAARTREDRALEDQTESQKRALADRHEAVLEGIADEEKAVKDAAEKATRRIDTQTKKVDDQHRKAVAQLEARKKAAEAAHDQAVRQLSIEGDAAELVHRNLLRAIQDETTAAEDRHDAVRSVLEDEQRAADDRHDAVSRALDDEQQAAEDQHDTVIRGIEDEVDAAETLHRATIDGLEDELAAAKKLHDREKGALEARSRAEDDRHRQVTDNLDAELQSQLAFLDATMDAQDAELEAEQRKLKIADLEGKLKEAQSTGNAEEVARAERAIADEQLDHQRDTIKDQLKAKRDALVAGGKAAKDAADEEHRRIEDAIKDEGRLLDERLDDVEASVRARKDAADDAYQLIKDEADARKRAADDELDLIQRSVHDRQQAADDEHDQITRSVKDRQDAADLDLKHIKDVLDARKIAADDDLTKIRDGLAARKQALDDEKTARGIVFDDEKTKLDDKERREKDHLANTKQRIEDERDSAIDALDTRKKREEDDNEESQRRQEDALRDEKRRIADQRTTEDLAAEDKRKAAEETARVEQLQIHDTADAAIRASKDALDAYNTDYDLRKQKADDTYNNEKDQIKATYDDPETGLIPKLKKAYDETKKWYDERTREVNLQYQNERDQIADTFDNKDHGLFTKLEKIHQATVDALKDTEEDWNKNFKEPVTKVADATFAAVKSSFDKLLGDMKVDVKSGDDDDKHGGGRGSQQPSGRGPSPGGVPSPWRVTFPYDAPYNGPFSGGAAWAGGPARHQGVDLALPGPNNGMGTAYGAFQSGTVYWTGFEPAGGNGIIIRTDDGLYNYYGHNQRVLVKAGEHVDEGDHIGVLGESGTEGSPHLHYAVRRNVNSDHIDPVPFMSGEQGDDGGDRDLGNGIRLENGYLIYTLFGQQYRIKLPASSLKGSALLKAIERIGKEIGGAEFGRVAAAVADSEGADGDLSKPGTGGARGPFQFDPGGELRTYAKHLGMNLEEAGDYAGRYPLEAARWALEGYLGEAIKRGQDREGLSGADLAVYASRVGQRPQEGLEERAGDAYRKLYGYARGGYIPEPTLLVGRSLGPYAIAGENAPEWVTPQVPGPDTALRHTTVEMPIMIGNREVERLWIDGYNLNVQRGRKFLGTVPR